MRPGHIGRDRRILGLVAAAVLLPSGAVRGQRPRLPGWVDASWWARRQIEPPWALTDVNVVDVRTGRIQSDMSVIIRGDRIEEVRPGPIQERMRTVSGEGGYLIPGLFDLHAHVVPAGGRFGAPPPEEVLEQFLRAGVTTIRLLPLYSESAVLWAARVSHGDLVGPSIVPASQVFEKEAERSSAGFGDPATAAEWVRREALLGSRWIKIYNSMDSASLETIVREAQKHGIRVGGHAVGVPPDQASRLGVASIEHHTELAMSCLIDDAGDPPEGMLARSAWAWTHRDPARCEALVASLVERGTAWVPTLVVAEQILERGGHESASFRDASERHAFEEGLRSAAELAVRMHRMGGRVGLGTDTPVDGVVPGSSAHRELELLVVLGSATPAEALRIGTMGSAAVLGFEDLLGSVDAGKLAQLVVLGSNPLEEIGAVRDVRMVVHEGRILVP